MAWITFCSSERERRRDGGDDIVHRYRDDPLGFITEGLGQCRESSWGVWRLVLKAAYGVPLNDRELDAFRKLADRDPPSRRVKELWLIVGARGGKDSVASTIAAQSACYADEGMALRPGERALVACFANDRGQASIIYNYTRAYFERVPSLRRRVISSLDGALPRPITLSNSTEIRVVTNNFRAPRGWPIATAIFDECAFWRDEDSATPDKETYIAVLRGSGPQTMIIGITTPYRQSGLVYEKWKEYYGKNDDDVLVIRAATTTFRPTFDRSIIDRAMREDPERARAEYLAEWRRDLADFVPREVVESCVVPDRYALAPVAGTRYVGFVDPSGGSSDSMTMAIAHHDPKTDRQVLDFLHERRAPFSPSEVVAEFVPYLKTYKIHSVVGDHYAGEWPREQFRKHGIAYQTSELTKVEIYRESLPLLTTGTAELLDVKRLIDQICGLERRTARGGRDSIDHAPGAHDDAANAALGALTLISAKPGPTTFSAAQLAQLGVGG